MTFDDAMTKPLDAREIEQRYLAACHIAREAGVIAFRHYQGMKELKVETKGLQDYVSNWNNLSDPNISSNVESTSSSSCLPTSSSSSNLLRMLSSESLLVNLVSCSAERFEIPKSVDVVS
ncbi:MAG: hypothetical protein IH899_02480 [Planctomycetes bacterium]|nr:hypothetical protein [Planctomycetota bacterium]